MKRITPSIDPAIVLTALGDTAVGIMPLVSGGRCEAWRIDGRKRSYALRIFGAGRKAGAAAAEMSIRSYVARLGGAVSRPILGAQDLSQAGGGADWVLDSFVEGQHCARGEIGAAEAADLGRTLAILHAVPVDGYGIPFVTPGGAIAGESETPLAGVLSRFDDPLPTGAAVARHPLIMASPAHADSVEALVRNIRTEVAAGAAAVCHTDLHERQFIFRDRRLAALIDFGDATIADPRWDFASIRYFHGASAATAVIDGYTDDPGRRREMNDGAALFSVAIALHHASRSRLPGKAHRLTIAASYLDELLRGPIQRALQRTV